MTTLVLRFPGGRYHATPGRHHVNEGIVEWPPSPWRLIRALIACGYSSLQWDDVPPAGRRLVESLSSVLPEFRLPEAALGHSRHYMPLGVLDKGREKTILVLDSFADLGDGAVWVRWPVTLDDEAQSLFGVLASHLGYLGRSESLVLAEAVSDAVTLPEGGRALPHSGESRPGRGFEQVVIAAPEVPAIYAAWRENQIEGVRQEFLPQEGKKPAKAQQKKFDVVMNSYPLDIVDCLQRDTAWWKARKWSQAPGMRSVLYWRETNTLKVGPSLVRRVSSVPRAEMMLLALTTPSGLRTALPTVARTLPQAELLHKALVSQLGYGGEPCPELVGRDEYGNPLNEQHAHAHVVPIDLDGDGRLDHVVLFARMGFGARAQGAIRSLRRTYMKGGVGELQVAIAGIGALSDLRNIGEGLSNAVEGFLGPTGGATSWISETPFVPPRYLKKQGRSSLLGQVEAELDSRGFPSAKIEVLDWAVETLELRHYVRRRRRGPQPPLDVGFAVRLKFERPVLGPICIGYGSHFGLGRFSVEGASTIWGKKY